MADRTRDRLLELYQTLLAAYGPQGWWPGEGPFEVVVGAVLTQATSWRNVEQALVNLKAAGTLSPEAMANLPPDELAALIRPAGFFRQKARRLAELVAWIERSGGLSSVLRLPTAELRASLLAVPGIGPETADSILLYAAGRPVFVVDAYTRRILTRLGLLPHEHAPYPEVTRLFTDHLPPDPGLYGEYHALLVRHGKERCRKRPRCPGCPVAAQCPFPSGSTCTLDPDPR
ncbi:endonuclease III domain-containing protein [Candidatus Bipolaricaulota bacterium]|nr:endonuclease III domain-containing protein [Candidatus Bipolaricaulota bacterium]